MRFLFLEKKHGFSDIILIRLHVTRIKVLDLNVFSNCFASDGGRLLRPYIPDACIQRDNQCHSCNEPQIWPIENLIFVPTHTTKMAVLIYKIYDDNITFMGILILFTEDKSLYPLIKVVNH